jgi:hypothetical protein
MKAEERWLLLQVESWVSSLPHVHMRAIKGSCSC